MSLNYRSGSDSKQLAAALEIKPGAQTGADPEQDIAAGMTNEISDRGTAEDKSPAISQNLFSLSRALKGNQG